ncbi:MAG TPA: efflux RND transporter periplasmic adaptor subunit [Myxococcota bacterium]|nr:efflux RND transporter periplasmic adaptor subunit [Myxococcota bacterium]
MNTRTPIYFFVLVLLIASLSCNKSNPAEATAAAQAKPDEHGGHGTQTGKGHEEDTEAKEPSDLDRLVEELIALTCEHKKKTFECDECRYEVGFVRAPASLTEGGLVTTVNVERQKVAAPIALTGEIRFNERRVGHVSTQVEGVIKQVHVALGDPVKKGQPLITIESVTVGESQAAYLEARGMLTLARRNFERVSDLHKENISSEKEFLLAKQELDAAEIRAAGARSKLSRLGTGGTSGGRLVLRAPIDGTVLVMHAVSGEVAKTDESLVTVGDNTAVWVWADMYERDIAAVKKGQAAQKLAASISVKAYPGEEFPGIVDLVSPAMNESSRTVKVRVQVKNDDGRLLAGMFAGVKLFLPGTDETLAVPRNAVLEDEGRSFVFVHHLGEYYVRRAVITGRTWAGWVEIKKGLLPTQTVVAEGAFLMKSDVLRSKMGAGCAD